MIPRKFFFVLLLLSAVTSLHAQNKLPFEAEIRAFERLDSLQKPAKGQILLYGSSTMRLWTTYKEDLAGYQVINRGFGGSQTSDANYYFDRVVVPLQPSWILFYEGDNDLSNGNKTPQQVFADFTTFMGMVKQKLPDTKVAVYSLRPSLAREKLMPQQRELNAMLKKYCRKHRKKAYFIDMYNALLAADGKAFGGFLADDKLHLNKKGYGVWTEFTLTFLKRKGL